MSMIFIPNIVLVMLMFRSFISSFRLIRGLNHYQLSKHVLSFQPSYAIRLSSIPSKDNASKKIEKDAIKAQARILQNTITSCLKAQDPTAAIDILKNLNMTEDKKNLFALTSLVTLFTKKEHLQLSQDIIERIKKAGILPSEPVLNSLIRCHTDAKNVDGALDVVKFMLEHKIQPKIRSLLPILEVFVEINDFERFVILLNFILDSLLVKPEVLTLTLNLIAKKPDDMVLSEPVKTGLNDFLTHCSQKLLGLPVKDLQRVASHFNKISLEEQLDQGVLSEFKPEFYLSDKELRTKGYVTVTAQHCQNPGSDMIEAVPTVINTNPSNPIVEGEQSEMTDYVEKLFLRSEVDTLRKSSEALKSRIVNVDIKTCRCPNCNVMLSSLTLNENEKQLVRAGLRNLSPALNEQLTYYKEFLQNYLEFDYIVDAANVAYFGQNDNGKGHFSYTQIELVVNKLKQKSNRILVVIPQSYTRPKYFNSISGEMCTMSMQDKKILEQLHKNVTVYQVPSGHSDDWFWIYASVMGRRRSSRPTYIVSNDLTRDHKPAFPDSATFTRWRLSQMLYYELYRNEVTRTSDVKLHEPGKFSRLMQKNILANNGETRWHIPSTDRSSWLCVHTGTVAPVKITNTTVNNSNKAYPLYASQNISIVDVTDKR